MWRRDARLPGLRRGSRDGRPASLVLIGVTIVFSSFLSGVFGMAGGMVLLGVLLVYFDVATAMMLLLDHPARSPMAGGPLQWRRFVLWRIFGSYAVGALLAFAAMRMSRSCPTRRWSICARADAVRR